MYLWGGHCFRLWDSWNCKMTWSRHLANPPLKASTFVLTTQTQHDQRILTSSSSNTAALSVALSFKLSGSYAPCCMSTGALSLSLCLSQHMCTHTNTLLLRPANDTASPSYQSCVALYDFSEVELAISSGHEEEKRKKRSEESWQLFNSLISV